jgi:hypothetical protein
MGDFDFAKSVVENGKVYCTDSTGNIYEMSLPRWVSVQECPQGVITKLLAIAAKRS